MSVTKTKTTPLDLARRVIELAVEQPDHVYEPPEMECFYSSDKYDDGQVRRCIVGEAMNRCGVPVDELLLNKNVGDVNMLLDEGDLGEYIESPAYVFDDLSVQFLSRVQRRQDEKQPWGTALLGALDHLDLPTLDLDNVAPEDVDNILERLAA